MRKIEVDTQDKFGHAFLEKLKYVSRFVARKTKTRISKMQNAKPFGLAFSVRVPGTGLEPVRLLRSQDFKCCISNTLESKNHSISHKIEQNPTFPHLISAPNSAPHSAPTKEDLSIKKYKTILEKDGSVYSDQEVLEIREFLHKLAEMEYGVFEKQKRKDDELKREKSQPEKNQEKCSPCSVPIFT